MKGPLVSIIIPVHNTEKYIEDCLTSITEQTYKNLEIIIIDDGSSDGTPEILRRLSLRDKRIKMITGEQMGANRARGKGIKCATGNYYMFVDSDDWLELDAVERLVDYMKENHYDTIKFNAVMEPGRRLVRSLIKEWQNHIVMSGNETRLLLATDTALNNLCFQMYDARLFQEIDAFTLPISNCEDFLANLEIYNRVNKTLFVGDILYHYRINLSSTTKNSELKRIETNLKEQIFVRAELQRYADDWNFSDGQKKEVAFRALCRIRSGIFALFRAEGINKEKFTRIVQQVTNSNDFKKITKRLSNDDLKKFIREMPKKERAKHSRSIRALYYNDIGSLWKNAYTYRLYYNAKTKHAVGGNINKYMRGRLGNQLFQYATLRQIQEINRNNHTLCLNFSRYIYSLGFEDELKYFKVKPYQEVDKIKMTQGQKCLILLHKTIKRIYRLLFPKNYSKFRYNFENKHAGRLQKNGIYWKEDGTIKIGATEKRNIIAIGHFESLKNFDSIRPKLLEEIQPIHPPLEKNKKLYEVIDKSESVCVSIRRGDYVENPKFSKKFNVCGEQYFKKAVLEIKKHVKNPVFIIFSDDIEWCKKNITLQNDKIYFEDGTDPVWEKLRLMYSCKHFIISNSTFSWWAQYLSRNDNKIVVAPVKWANSGYHRDIYEDCWKLVDNIKGKKEDEQN